MCMNNSAAAKLALLFTVVLTLFFVIAFGIFYFVAPSDPKEGIYEAHFFPGVEVIFEINNENVAIGWSKRQTDGRRAYAIQDLKFDYVNFPEVDFEVSSTVLYAVTDNGNFVGRVQNSYPTRITSFLIRDKEETIEFEQIILSTGSDSWLVGSELPLDIEDPPTCIWKIENSQVVEKTTHELPGIPYDLNERGHFIGFDGRDGFVFDYETESITVLKRLEPRAINANGTIVCHELYDRAVVWNGGQTEKLKAPNDARCRIEGMNGAGACVGSYVVKGEGSRAFLWKDGWSLDLNEALGDAGEGIHLRSAKTINNHGWIAAEGTKDDAVGVFFLIPNPDYNLLERLD